MDWRAVIHLTCTQLSSTHGQPSKCICNVYITHIQESSTFFAKGQTSATTRDMAGHRQVQRSRPTATRLALHLPYCPLNLVKVVKKKWRKREEWEEEEEEDVADSRWFVCSFKFLILVPIQGWSANLPWSQVLAAACPVELAISCARYLRSWTPAPSSRAWSLRQKLPMSVWHRACTDWLMRVTTSLWICADPQWHSARSGLQGAEGGWRRGATRYHKMSVCHQKDGELSL